MLAYDIDGDGKIDKPGEISFSRYKDDAQTDLEGLAGFDSNGDGRFTAADAKWSSFGVWQDADQDGVTDAGEFKSLDALGISAVELTSDGQFSVINGQTVHGVGSMKKNDGSTLAIADVTLAFSNETQIPQPGGTRTVTPTSPFSPNGELLEGTPDKDLILGKNGNNIVKGYAGDDVIFEDGGNDIIDAGDGNDMVYSGADNDLVMGGAGDDAIYAGLGSDVVFGGDGQDAILAEGGNDVVFGGDGNDLLSGGWGNDILSGDDGDDQVYGELGNDALFGRDGDDELVGMDGNDRLDGGLGNDLLDGGNGNDEMIGGAGNDTYIVDSVGDSVTEAAAEGTDTVVSRISFALSDTLENLTLAGTASTSAIGNANDNVLIGNSGANVITGYAGNDRLDGGAGADTLIGGAGDDFYVLDNTGDTVVEAVDEGLDVVYSSVSYRLADNVETLLLTGFASIDGSGNALNNSITGNRGNNVLDGRGGVDVLRGGLGNDTYIVDSANDVTIEFANEGVDSVQSSVSWTLSDTIENLVLTGTTDINALGNSTNNVLVGNSGANLLDGGLGADTLVGGLGDDTYRVEDVNDVVVENANGGNDSVISLIDYTLTDNVENLTLIGTENTAGQGNILDNVITGNAGNNLLDGQSGADALAGGLGDDTYIVDNLGDTVTETESGGIDAVFSSVSFVLPEYVEDLTLTGTGSIAGTGNDLDNVIYGNEADNFISGQKGKDILYGLGGNDILDGGADFDRMAGGLGDDLYYVDRVEDVVEEASLAGYDTVRTSVSLQAPDFVERAELLGGGDLDLTGNDLNNTLLGNSGANRLDGGLGSDNLIGGLGNDIYIVDNAVDTVIEARDGGDDLVLSSVTYSLSDNVERMTLTGSANIDATGNALDNTLAGNSGNNRLDGGIGADSMSGQNGDDEYRVDNAGDIVSESSEAGIDSIFATVSYVLPENVENLYLLGADQLTATGNSLDNLLVGNIANNSLSGLAGDDVLVGAAGNDILSGGFGDDQLSGSEGDDILSGEEGIDTLDGGVGNDTYNIALGGGLDRIVDEAGLDTVRFGAGLTLENLALRVSMKDGALITNVRVLNAGGCEIAEQGFDFAVTQDGSGNYVSPLERFEFSDGSLKSFSDLQIKTKIFEGNSKTQTIKTGRDDDIIYAGSKNDIVYAGSGNDIVYAAAGADTVYAEGGDDYLQGAAGNDILDGGCGTDILSGGNGDDVIRDAGGGNAILLGGQGRDVISGGADNDFIAGGKNDDVLDGGAGYNVFAFSGEDGRDVILPALGARNTLSLAAGDHDDLALRKSGMDLILETDSDSTITFRGWYADMANRNFTTLQLISEGDDGRHHPEYDEDMPFDAAVETFNFQILVDKFDQARAANAMQSRWNVMSELLDAHLSSSNNAALGGDLAFRYSQEGDLKGMTLLGAQSTLKDANFGMQAQAIHSPASLEPNLVKLA